MADKAEMDEESNKKQPLVEMEMTEATEKAAEATAKAAEQVVEAVEANPVVQAVTLAVAPAVVQVTAVEPEVVKKTEESKTYETTKAKTTKIEAASDDEFEDVLAVPADLLNVPE